LSKEKISEKSRDGGLARRNISGDQGILVRGTCMKVAAKVLN